MYSKTIPAGITFCLFLSAFTLIELLTSADDAKTDMPTMNQKVASIPETIIWGTINIIKDHSGKNIIQWSTLKENNTREFLIQHSENGHTFRAFKRVVAVGNTSKRYQYQAIDNKSKGDNYYRIIGIDNEGKVFYSKVVRN
jgi:hypothetical protein